MTLRHNNWICYLSSVRNRVFFCWTRRFKASRWLGLNREWWPGSFAQAAVLLDTHRYEFVMILMFRVLVPDTKIVLLTHNSMSCVRSLRCEIGMLSGGLTSQTTVSLVDRKCFSTTNSKSLHAPLSAKYLVDISPVAIQPYLRLIRADKPAGLFICRSFY